MHYVIFDIINADISWTEPRTPGNKNNRTIIMFNMNNKSY